MKGRLQMARTQPYVCRICRHWGKFGDAGVTCGKLPSGARYILCGRCSDKLAGASGLDREELIERISTVVSETEILA